MSTLNSKINKPQSLGHIMQQKLREKQASQTRKDPVFYRANVHRAVVIESSKDATKVRGIPKKVYDLIDDKAYCPKFVRLITDGYEKDLLELADLAPKMAKQEASHWFAKATAKAKWSKTLEWLEKARKVTLVAMEAAKRIGATAEQMKPIYKSAWKLGQGIIRYAVSAEEAGKTARNKLKLFLWLVGNHTPVTSH